MHSGYDMIEFSTETTSASVATQHCQSLLIKALLEAVIHVQDADMQQLAMAQGQCKLWTQLRMQL